MTAIVLKRGIGTPRKNRREVITHNMAHLQLIKDMILVRRA